jgi:hypothetical protein
MNRLFSTPLLLFLLFNSSAFAQNKDNRNFLQVLKGTITDKESRLSLAGATVSIADIQTPKAASTNENGIFQIGNVPVGRHTITITSTGYRPVQLTEVLLTTGKETVLNIELEPLNNKLNEVVISASSGKQPLNQMALASGRSFSPEETNRYAGAFFDPARMAQTFAGVVAAGDNNEIIVRGNSPKSLQWRLEGIEIINPNHFSAEGAAGGAVSMINTTVLGTSDFYTGALGAEYNNANSGVFDLKFRKGNTDRREYTFNIGALGAGLTMEGPFSKGSAASYLVSYRYSSLGLLKDAGIEVSDAGVPQYQDLSFNIVVPTKSTGTFSLFGIGGLGNLNSDAKRDINKWEERMDAYDIRSKYHSGSAGLKHLYIANSKLYFSNILSYSNSLSNDRTDTLTNSYVANLAQKSKYGNSALRYAGMVNYRLSKENTLRTGLNAAFLEYELYATDHKATQGGLTELLNQNGNAHTFDAFIQDKQELGAGVTVNAGLHASYFNLSNSWNLEPRLGLKFELPADQRFNFATGLYSRLEPLSYYFARASSDQVQNNSLSPTKSAQAVFSYEKLWGSLKFKSEVYYQHLYNVPVSSDPTVNFSLLNESDNAAIGSGDYRSLVNKGKGKNYGLELSLERSLKNGYYFMITSSLFDSKFQTITGQEFNTAFNTQYVGNLLAGKEWTVGKRKKNLLGLNAKLIYAGGRRYSPVLVQESMERDEWVIDQTRVNTLKAEPYMRLDYSLSYRINGRRVSHFLLLDVQNGLNKRNTIGVFYNSSKRIVEANKWIGIIPTINYRIEI